MIFSNLKKKNTDRNNSVFVIPILMVIISLVILIFSISMSISSNSLIKQQTLEIKAEIAKQSDLTKNHIDSCFQYYIINCQHAKPDDRVSLKDDGIFLKDAPADIRKAYRNRLCIDRKDSKKKHVKKNTKNSAAVEDPTLSFDSLNDYLAPTHGAVLPCTPMILRKTNCVIPQVSTHRYSCVCEKYAYMGLHEKCQLCSRRGELMPWAHKQYARTSNTDIHPLTYKCTHQHIWTEKMICVKNQRCCKQNP